ncbi:putative elongator complex protein 4 [Zancudomyces culisetae]|nr:putative elongator complex protein 4 [Zancudomyces culisetae]|eukprot:OMH82986.1 putative elongator complex protein 4 [Zancudomyces culisetae]
MLSLPVSLYKDTGSEQRQTIVRRIEHQCDAVVELESFEGAECGELAILKTQKTRNVISNQSNEYHGFFHIHKNFSLNSMFPIADKTSLLKSEGSGGSENNLAFKLKKKKFSIETYHLPIEGGTSERRVPDSASSGSNSSATGVPNRLTTKLSQRQSNLSQSVTDF